METFLLRANLFFENLPDLVRKYRWIVWSLFLIINIAIFAGASRFKIDMSMEAYFQEDDPIKQAYDRFRRQFGGDEFMLLVYEANDGNVFSNDSLRAVKGIQDELLNYRLHLDEDQESHLDRITDVDTIVNASYMESRTGDLISRQFIGDALPASEQKREQWRRQAYEHPDYPKQFISEDGRYGAIVIRTDFNARVVDNIVLDDTGDGSANDSTGSVTQGESADSLDQEFAEVDMEMSWDDGFSGEVESGLVSQSTSEELASQTVKFERAEIEEYSRFMDEVNPILEKEAYKKHLTFFPVGNPPMMTFFAEIIMTEMAMVCLGCIVIICLALWLLFRSLSAVVWSLCIVIISFLWIIGLVGWTGVTMTFMINIIVFLILAVGVADAIHILSGYLFFRDHGEDHPTALRSVFKKSGLACLLTSLTTAVGLCALILVPVIPIRNFGLFAALGVFVAFLLTVFILPLMLDLWAPVRKKIKDSDKNASKRVNFIQRCLRRVEDVGYDNPKYVIAIFSVFTLAMLYGMSQVKVNTNIVEIIPEDSLLRQSYDLANEKFSGAQNMEIILDAGTEDAFKDPAMLNRMESLQNYILDTYPDRVGRTTSLVNVTKDAFKALNEDRKEMYIIPQDREVLEQTLFMFNNANLKDRRQLVSDDYSEARITISFRNAGSYVYSPIMDDIQNQTNMLFSDMTKVYPELDTKLTGTISLMLKLMDYVSWSQIQSFGLALIVISILLLMVFGSVRVGTIAIVPNLMPILTAFGLMGFLDMSLDTDTLLVAPIIIGIAVDDTIHFLTHFRLGMLQTGNMREAVRLTIREAGQAISFTSIVLSLGFLVFIMSSHMSLRHFGFLSAAAIIMALVTDLLLLPALAKVAKADFSRARKRHQDNLDLAGDSPVGGH